MPVSCTLSANTNKPVNGSGGGNTSPGWAAIDAHNVQSSRGTVRGRLGVACGHVDRAGSASKFVTVAVPHVQGP